MKIVAGLLALLLGGGFGCARNTAPQQIVEITGNDFMNFSPAQFEVKPGQKVTVKLKNIGELPKDAMAHNWVLLDQQVNAGQFAAASQALPANDYIAAPQTGKILARTKMLGPGEADSVTFTAPANAGSYEYVCTFPEHFGARMKGVMIVRP